MFQPLNQLGHRGLADACCRSNTRHPTRTVLRQAMEQVRRRRAQLGSVGQMTPGQPRGQIHHVADDFNALSIHNSYFYHTAYRSPRANMVAF